ncbi:MAG: HmuY family protein [Bacteroidota bacterium]
MKHFKKLPYIAMLAALCILSACNDDDDALPVLGIAFETTAIGIPSDATDAEVVISFSRAFSVASTLSMTVMETAVMSGVDYSTTPAIAGNNLTVSVDAGALEASFTVTRIADFIRDGSNIVFTLTDITGEENAEISGNTAITVSFDAIASPGSSLVAEIGGATQPNQVFVDFSLNQQHTAERVSWDLGFYTGEDDKVIVNYSTYTMAQALSKTDMNEVTSADTVGFSGTQVIGTAGAHVYVDHPDRDLENLAIADISATDGDNPVYIINRGAGPGTGDVDPGSVDVGSTPRGWKKVRILMDGEDYVIQHADIDATSFEEVTIAKSGVASFNYFSFEEGADREVEPAAWDIVFSVSSNIINFGAGDGAYGFSDFVLSNRQGGVQVARVELERDDDGVVIDGQTGYDDFTADDLGSVDFSASGNIIGSSWRSVFSRSAFDYVFFIVQDDEGNNYKVQFLGLLDEMGNRGNSSLKYELL